MQSYAFFIMMVIIHLCSIPFALIFICLTHAAVGCFLMKFLLIFFLLFSVHSKADSLKPFTSDGCSAFPDGTLAQKDLWLACCYEHDMAYWQGGTAEQRNAADQQLKSCVADVGEPVIAQMMLAGVRVGGNPYWPTKFRWAYGWPYTRGYQALNQEESDQVKQLLEAHNNQADVP